MTREEAIQIAKECFRFNGSQGESHISPENFIRLLHELGVLPLAEKAKRK
jgi:hypothetical protein